MSDGRRTAVPCHSGIGLWDAIGRSRYRAFRPAVTGSVDYAAPCGGRSQQFDVGEPGGRLTRWRRRPAERGEGNNCRALVGDRKLILSYPESGRATGGGSPSPGILQLALALSDGASASRIIGIRPLASMPV